MVVASHGQHAAEARGAGGVGVAEDVAAAIHSRPLAVPQGEDAVVLGAGEEPHLLRAPDGGGGEVFVDAGLENDVVRAQVFLGAPQGLIEPAQRRAAIAGDEPGRVESGGFVAFALDEQQAHER